MKDKRAVSCSACASINLELKRKLEKLFLLCACVYQKPESEADDLAVQLKMLWKCVCWCLLTGWKCYKLSQMWEAWEVIRMKQNEQNEATSPPPLLRHRGKEGGKEGEGVKGAKGEGAGRLGRRERKSETDSQWGKGGKIKTGNEKKVKGREVETLKK